jgi:hypothetical protein
MARDERDDIVCDLDTSNALLCGARRCALATVWAFIAHSGDTLPYRQARDTLRQLTNLQ